MRTIQKQALMLGMVLCAAPMARGQEDDPRPVNPLATKQQMIEDRLSRLEDRMFRLREKLAETEPQNAELLAAALEQAGALDVKGRTAAIVKLLEKANQLDASKEEQEALIADLESLLSTLLNRDPNDEKRKAELQRLEQIKRDLDEIAREQLRQRHRAADAVRAERAAQQLDAALKQIDSMLEQQGRLSDETRKGEGENSETKKKQSDLAEQAKRLAEEIKRLAEQSAPSEPSQSQKQQSQGQQSEGQQSEQQSGEQSQQQPSQQQGSQQQDSQAQKSDSKSSEQSSESKSQSPSDDMKQASKDLDKSGEHMDQAAEQLEKSDAEQAGKAQAEAEEELRRARHRLEEARKELEKKADSEKKESEQRQLAQRTDDLSQKMKGQQDGSQQGQQQGGEQEGGQQQEGGEQQQGQQQSGDQEQQQEPAPGQQNVERAQQQMDKAADDLKESKDEDAIEKQDRALAELEQAQRELEDALRQLRQEEQEEILRNLNSRLTDMVARQATINTETSQLAAGIDGDPSRADQLKAADLASRQEELARDADSAVRLLEEDGTTVVFLNVFRQISSDMYHVAGELAQVNAGTLTQSTQAGILETLQELLDAVKKLQEQQQGGQGGAMAGGGSGDPPLVPTSAELRMLKTSQLRVNQQTDVAAEALQKGDANPTEVSGVLKRASARQAQLKDMARELQERAEKGR